MEEPAILIIEDDDAIGAGLERVLTSQGHRALRVASGEAGLRAAGDGIGLTILDLGLPDMDGIDVCRTLRADHPDMAILIVTARDHEIDIVAGLDAGADDYLVKPFGLSELLARVRAHLRRRAPAPPPADETLSVGEIVADPSARRAWRGDTELALRPKEFDLLVLLLSEAGHAVTRERLMSEVWDTEWMGSTKTLDMHIHALRRKVGADAIATLRGVGYRFEAR